MHVRRHVYRRPYRHVHRHVNSIRLCQKSVGAMDGMNLPKRVHAHAYTHYYTHIYTNFYTHAYTHIHTRVYEHVKTFANTCAEEQTQIDGATAAPLPCLDCAAPHPHHHTGVLVGAARVEHEAPSDHCGPPGVEVVTVYRQ